MQPQSLLFMVDLCLNKTQTRLKWQYMCLLVLFGACRSCITLDDRYIKRTFSQPRPMKATLTNAYTCMCYWGILKEYSMFWLNISNIQQSNKVNAVSGSYNQGLPTIYSYPVMWLLYQAVITGVYCPYTAIQ